MSTWTLKGYLWECGCPWVAAGTDLELDSASSLESYKLHGAFRKLGVPFLGVLRIRILLFRVLFRVPYFRKLPHVKANTSTPRDARPLTYFTNTVIFSSPGPKH